MQSLDDLAAQLATRDAWDDEDTVVDALVAAIEEERPSCLTEAAGEWEEPYLHLELMHRDGTAIKVTHGDGYTAVVGGGVDYRGYLDTASLIDVLIGAIRGRSTYVHHARFGHKVADYFEVVGREGERLGERQGLAGALPFLLRSIPLPERVRRTRVSFDDTSALAVV